MKAIAFCTWRQVATSVITLAWMALLFLGDLPPAGPLAAQSSCRLFAETGKTVCGRFLQYWEQHGGLPQYGFPLSDEIREKSQTDGQVYTVQYFERAVAEFHPQNPPPHEILLTLLGVFRYQQKYPTGAPNQQASTFNPYLFPPTGKTLGGRFREYWEQHGGLAQQGYPISEEFTERSDLDGQTYRVQYFERAVFEYHPANAPPYDVLLAQLGTVRYAAKPPLPAPACYNFFMRPGNVIAQGTNNEPEGIPDIRGLKTYRVEAVSLPAPLTCYLMVPDPVHTSLKQQTIAFDQFWYLIVTGGPFHEGGGSALSIWLDDMVIGLASPSVSGELRTLVYDPAYLREGASISVGWGLAPDHREFLKETLHLNRAP